MKKYILLPLIVLTTLFLFSCDEDDDVYSPKPKGYIRIDFPEKKYVTYVSECPFSFDIPVYARMKLNNSKGSEPCWYNLEFPNYKATLHLSYKQVSNNLSKYLDDAHEIANKHQIKATGLDEVTVLRDSAKVYGLLFDIAGNTASSVQFYLTDSTKHFLRGSLYFNAVPNADSLKIVVDFLKKDIIHMINTTAWKK
jgi:gliding motility-associated lipoprotein GldD